MFPLQLRKSLHSRHCLKLRSDCLSTGVFLHVLGIFSLLRGAFIQETLPARSIAFLTSSLRQSAVSRTFHHFTACPKCKQASLTS